MANRAELAKQMIEAYLGRTVVADLDGSLFDHVPATFAFDFGSPDELLEVVKDEYGDYVHRWNFDELVPVARVSATAAPDYAFAWLFLDWTEGKETPRVLITTSDRWKVDPRYAVASLDQLALRVT